MLKLTPTGIERLFTEAVGSLSGTVSLLEGAEVGLYKDSSGPILTLSDVTECDFSGYARQPFTPGDKRTFPDDARGRSADATFEGSGTGTVNLVKGEMLVSADDTLIAYRSIPTDDQPIMGATDSEMRLVVNIFFPTAQNFGDVIEG